MINITIIEIAKKSCILIINICKYIKMKRECIIIIMKMSVSLFFSLALIILKTRLTNNNF